MNCAMPCARLQLRVTGPTASGLRRLTSQIRRAKNSTGSSFCAATDWITWQSDCDSSLVRSRCGTIAAPRLGGTGGCSGASSSTLPPLATHLLKQSRLDCTVPFARPAAGLPGTCGGYALAVRAAHFLATSAVTADALPFMHPTAMQTNPTSALSNFTWANMVYPKAKHRGLTIAGLTVSVAVLAGHRHCPVLLRLASRYVSSPAGRGIAHSSLFHESQPKSELPGRGSRC